PRSAERRELVIMRALDIKLVRNLGRLWAQSVAIALVMACGVATLILSVGAYRSLDDTRSAYYERNLFADVFANAVRVPAPVASAIADIPGVAAVEARIVRPMIIDMPGMVEPASGEVISLPDFRPARVNAIHLREGRNPERGRPGEVMVDEAF